MLKLPMKHPRCPIWLTAEEIADGHAFDIHAPSTVSCHEPQAQALGRVLRSKDAAVVGSAVNENATIITRDQRLLKFLNAVGIPVQWF